MRLEAPFAPLAARAAGVFDLVSRGSVGDSVEAELMALSGLEGVDYVAASQLPSSPRHEPPVLGDNDPMELDIPHHHRLSLPVACGHPKLEELNVNGAGESRRPYRKLPTIVSAPPDEET